jgi:DNA-binding CsgD family transcriptional regulator
VSLDAADLHAVLVLAEQLAADPPPSFATVCDLLREVVPSQSASFNDMALASGDFRYVIAPPQDEALAERLKPAYDRWFHQHPLITHAQMTPLGGALRFCDVPAADGFAETELYRSFYEPFGLRYQMVIQLPAPPAVIVGYALNRTPAQGEFSDRDRAVVNALAAHLAMHHRVVHDSERAKAMETEADRSGWSVVTVRSDGVVVGSSTPGGTAGLHEGDTVPAAIADLIAPDAGSVTTGADRFTRHAPHDQHDVVIGSDRWRCVVYPVPIGPAVLLVRPLRAEPTDTTPLIDAGLTPRQAEIGLQLARTGASNGALARSLGISEGTVKKHLEAIFRVLGVDNRAAAAVAVSERIAAASRPNDAAARV